LPLAPPLLCMVLRMSTFKARPYLFSPGAQLTLRLPFVSYVSSLSQPLVLHLRLFFIFRNVRVIHDRASYNDTNKPQ
jgi:hypothetical protein